MLVKRERKQTLKEGTCTTGLYVHVYARTHARTHNCSSLLSKNTVPEVRVVSRRHGEVTQGEALIFPRTGEHTAGVRRCRVCRSPVFMRPRSCPPPSASQLIVCSANTLVATRVTLIDERLEFK